MGWVGGGILENAGGRPVGNRPAGCHPALHVFCVIMICSARGSYMRLFGAMLVLVGSPMCWASVLEVGPIYINGSGSLYDPDPVEGLVGSVGTTFSAFGSNGTDSVSILAAIEPSPYVPMPSVGSSVSFSATTGPCLEGFSSFIPQEQCNANIDGIMGLAAFTNIGGGMGIVQVYALEDLGSLCMACAAGPLLAQAEVVTYSGVITSVSTAPPNSPSDPRFFSTFVLQSPEPSAGVMGLMGIAVLAGFRRRKLRN